MPCACCPTRCWAWLLGLTALVVAAWLLSVIGAVVAFSNFTLTRDGDRLRIRRGFVERRESTVPVARVRAVEVVEGLLRRPFALATVRMEVIGHDDEPSAGRTLFPLVRRDEARALLSASCPSWPTTSTAWRARRRVPCAATCCLRWR